MENTKINATTLRELLDLEQASRLLLEKYTTETKLYNDAINPETYDKYAFFNKKHAAIVYAIEEYVRKNS